MFKEVSQVIYGLFSLNSDFTDVMEHDGQVHLYPMAAPEGVNFPLSTYVLGEQTPMSKDALGLTADIIVWFGNTGPDYDACCDLVDSMVNTIQQQNNFEFVSAVIEFNPDFQSYSGLISVKINV